MSSEHPAQGEVGRRAQGFNADVPVRPLRAARGHVSTTQPRPPETLPPEGFAPEITAFTCNYCGYMAADTAGALRAEYPANVKLLRLPCTGKTDLGYLLDAFEQGADGVYVVACGLGNCHHERGNERARARVGRAKALMEAIGLEPERLDMFFVSGGMGATFAEIARGMVARVRALGPSPLRNRRRPTA